MKKKYSEVEMIENPDIESALNAAVSAIYFADNSDYLLGLYEVIKHLTGKEDLGEDGIRGMYRALNPEE